MLVAMIGSGRIISKTGRYRLFPIVGTLVTTLGLWLFSHVAVATPQWQLSIWMVVLGVGIGLYMQVMTLAVQNSIDRADMGTATSVVTFFRSMGASFGTAIFGAILTARLTYHLQQTLPAPVRAHLSTSHLQQSAGALNQLPPAILHDFLNAFAMAFQDVFLWTVPFAVITFLVALLLRETPLQGAARSFAEGEAFES